MQAIQALDQPATITSRRFVVGLLLIFVVAMGLRLAYFTAVENGQLGTPDTRAYEDLAARIHAGESYESHYYSGFGGYPADLTRPPGYPGFLAAISARPAAHQQRTALVQIVLSALLAVGIAVGVAALFSPTAGLAGGLLYAVDWTTIVNTPLSIADALLPIPIGAAFLLLALELKRRRARPGWLALSGILLGVACLVKPAAEVILIGVVLLLLLTLRPWRLVLIFVAAAALVVVPWAVRNSADHGTLTLSPISTANLYFETALGTDYYTSPISTNLDALQTRQDRMDLEWTAKRISPTERSDELRHLALSKIEGNLPIVLDQAAMGFLRTSFGTDAATVQQDWSASGHPSRVLTTLIPLAEVLIFWALVVFGTVASWRDPAIPKRVTCLLVLGVLLAILPAAEPGGYARFRTAAVPMMAMLGGAGLAWIWQHWRQRRDVAVHGRPTTPAS